MAKKLCEILLDAGIIDVHMFDRALEVRKHWKKKIGQILLDLRYINETILTETLALQHNIPTINLDRVFIKESTIAALTYDIIKKYRLLPFEVDQSRVKIAYCYNSDITLVTDFSHTIQYEVELYLTTESQLNTYLGMYLPQESNPVSDINWDSDEIAKQKGDVRRRIGEVVEAHDFRKQFIEEFFAYNQSLEDLQKECSLLVREMEAEMGWVQRMISKNPSKTLATIFHRAELLLNCLRQGASSLISYIEERKVEKNKSLVSHTPESKLHVKRLVGQLIEEGFLKQGELADWIRLAQEQHLSIPTLMIQKGVIDESKLGRTLSEYCEWGFSETNTMASRETKYLFTPKLLKRFCFLPLQYTAIERLTLAVFHPLEDKLVRTLMQVLGIDLDFTLLPRSEIYSKIEMEFAPLYGPAVLQQEQKTILTIFSARVNSLAVLSLYSGSILPTALPQGF